MSLSRRSMGWNGHCIRVFEEENLSVLWRNPPWSLGGVDVLFEIQTTVSFGVILRVVKFRRILDSVESMIRLNPWFIWNPMGGMAYLFRSSNESVLWLTLHRQETQGFRVFYTSYSIVRQISPLAYSSWFVFFSDDFGMVFNSPLACPPCGLRWMFGWEFWEVFQRPIGLILRTLRFVFGTCIWVFKRSPFRGIRDSGYQDIAWPLCLS